MKLLSLLAIAISAENRWRRASGAWGYTDQAAWSDNSEHCSKDSQSPIDITGAAVKNRADFSFDQHHYGKNYTWDGINNGHTIKFTPTGDGDMPMIQAQTLLEGDYHLGQFHFHWGSAMDKGSEHTVDGRRYFAELHLVHFKAEYAGIGPSLDHAGGLAVVGHFLEVVDTTEESAMDKFLTGMVGENLLATTDASEFSAEFNLRDLGLANFTDYYRYSGSLTTPPCNEVVQWTVVRETLKVNTATMNKMVSFSQDKLGVAVTDNYREVQALNGREIKLYSSDAAELDTVVEPVAKETGGAPADDADEAPAPEPEVKSEPEPEGNSGAVALASASAFVALAVTVVSL